MQEAEMRLMAAFGAILGIGLAGAAAAQKAPPPQYTVEDVQRALANPQSPADCAPGLTPDANGDCVPTGGHTRGFSLAPVEGPSSAAATPAPKPPHAPGTKTATATRPTHAASPAPAPAEKRRYNLLITFANSSSTLTSQAMSNADVFAQALQTPALANTRFEIAGHTNAVGSRDFNHELSKERAAAVVAYLTAHGVPADRLQAKAYGFDDPINASDPRAPENRRVEARPLN
jgi:outer membrane protein OmpA-like peptidoglycan-associated protein